MADALVYYLKPGETAITTPEDGDAAGTQAIVLSGGGMFAKHGAIVFTKGGNPPIKYVAGSGIAFVNGSPVNDAEIALKHNDRLILGNDQAFRVVDPLDPESKKPSKLIDWDLAQNELQVLTPEMMEDVEETFHVILVGDMVPHWSRDLHAAVAGSPGSGSGSGSAAASAPT